MKRGMGRIIQGVVPIGAAVAGRAWGSAITGTGPSVHNMPHFDRGGFVEKKPGANANANMRDLGTGYFTGATWQPTGPINSTQDFMAQKPKATGETYGVPLTQQQDRGGVYQGGNTMYRNATDQANANAWNLWGQQHDMFPKSSGFMDALANKWAPGIIQAATVGGLTAGFGGAMGFGPLAGGGNAAQGLTMGGGMGNGGLNAASLGTGGSGFSMTPEAINAFSSGIGGAAGAGGFGFNAGQANMGGAQGLQAPGGWETGSQLGLQAPGGWETGSQLGLQPPYGGGSAVPWGDNIGNGVQAWDGGGFGSGGGYGGNGAQGLRMPNGTQNGMQPMSNTNFSGDMPTDFSLNSGGVSQAPTNAGFNASVDEVGLNQPYGDFGDVPQGAQPPAIKPESKSIASRIIGGAKSTVENLPENIGKSLPMIGASLIGQYVAGGDSKGQDQPGYAEAQQQAAVDQARNQMALKSQQEFAANASKYGNEGYYKQMGDMQGMQYRTGRIAQREQLQRQLQSQGRDPATVSAMLQQFDNATDTGAGNAQNTGYLSARNAGLAPQQAAAGMFASGTGASAMANISNKGNQNNRQRGKDISNLISAPFAIGEKEAGRDSGQVSKEATDAAAKASSSDFGLGKNQFGRN